MRKYFLAIFIFISSFMLASCSNNEDSLDSSVSGDPSYESSSGELDNSNSDELDNSNSDLTSDSANKIDNDTVSSENIQEDKNEAMVSRFVSTANELAANNNIDIKTVLNDLYEQIVAQAPETTYKDGVFKTPAGIEYNIIIKDNVASYTVRK